MFTFGKIFSLLFQESSDQHRKYVKMSQASDSNPQSSGVQASGSNINVQIDAANNSVQQNNQNFVLDRRIDKLFDEVRRSNIVGKF